jgi:hypothetical protein
MLVVLTLAITAVLAATPLAPPAMGKAKPRPDLIVTKAVRIAGGDEYAFKGKDGTLKLRFVTKNARNRGHDAAAHPSRTGIFLVPAHSSDPSPNRLKLGSRQVPGLAPGDSHKTTASEVVSTAILPLGAYKVLVCADVDRPRINERSESNNCRQAGNFYVAQESWRGSVNGIGSANGAARAETWKTLGAHFDFGTYFGGGVFFYDFFGTVTWNDHGVNSGGCTVDGHGEKTFDHVPELVLDYNAGTYKSKVHIDRFYTITLSGGGGLPCSGTPPGPANQDILSIPASTPLVFEQNRLNGQYSTGGGEGTTWNWDLQ